MPSQYNSNQHHRRSIRLPGYNYTAAGAYFITICTHQRECLFGEVENGEMRLNLFGEIVRSVWTKLPQHFRSIELDEFVIMPNHMHGIIWLSGIGCRGEAFAPRLMQSSQNVDTNASPLPCNGTKSGSIGAIVQNSKSISTRRINQIRKTAGIPIWQRNYYEHIIRDDRALETIQQYIQNNPSSWQQDQLHPNNQLW
jgi:putative transposase